MTLHLKHRPQEHECLSPLRPDKLTEAPRLRWPKIGPETVPDSPQGGRCDGLGPATLREALETLRVGGTAAAAAVMAAAQPDVFRP